MTAYFAAMSSYITFRGRASRAEFWQFSLVYMIGAFVIVILDQTLVPPGMANAGVLTALYALFHVLPGMALLVRRLHDTDRSGWWSLINITGIGTFVLLIFAMLRGTDGPNRHGPVPLWPPIASGDYHLPAYDPRMAQNEPALGSPAVAVGHAHSRMPMRDAAVNFTAPARPSTPTGEVIADLERIAQLHASGGLTDAEFHAMKARLLG